MAGVGATDLYQLAGEYLFAVRDALNTTVKQAPSRGFVSPGAPAWDCCDQLTVHVVSPQLAPTSPGVGALSDQRRFNLGDYVNYITLTATILRCVPTLDDDGNLPTVTAMDAAAQTILSDLWAVWNVLSQAKAAGTLFAGRCREMTFTPAVSQNPQGGCGGWEISAIVQLDSYRTGS